MGGLLEEMELGLVEMFVSLAFFMKELVLLFEGEEVLAKLAYLGYSCLDCFF